MKRAGYIIMAVGMLPGIGLAVLQVWHALGQLQLTPQSEIGYLIGAQVIMCLLWALVAAAGTIPGLVFVLIGKAAEKRK